MLTFLFALIVISGLTGGIFAAINVDNYWFIVAGCVPVLLLTLLVAPYKLWKEKVNTVTKLTTKRLEVEVEKEPEHAQNGIWWHLIVRNPSNVPIEGCYGQLLSFIPNKNKKPYQAINLPWSSLGGIYTQTITIPGKGYKYLDVAMTNGNYLYIVTLSPDPRLRGTPYPETDGIYRAKVKVGSEKEASEATEIKLKIVFKDGNLHIEKDKSNDGKR